MKTAVITSLLLIFSLRVAWLLADTLLAPGRARFRFLDIDPRSAVSGLPRWFWWRCCLPCPASSDRCWNRWMPRTQQKTLHILTAALGSLAVLATVLRHQHALPDMISTSRRNFRWKS